MLKTSTSIVVIGCGGIGSWLIPPLVRFLAAEKWQGRLTLIDGDKYEEKNANRQDFHNDFTGTNKAEAQLQKMQPLYPTMNMGSITQYVSDENVAAIIVENCVVFVCVDNHPARLRVDNHAQKLHNCCVFSAGNEELDGNVTVSLRRGGEQITLPLTARHPEVAKITTNDRAAGCEDQIEQGNTQLLITNLTAAVSAMLGFHKLWNPPQPQPEEEAPKRGKRKKKAEEADEKADIARPRVPKFVMPQELYFDVFQGAISTIPAQQE